MRRAVVSALALVSCAGAAFGQAAPLRITQVYGGGGSTGATYGRDFVEILNYGPSPIDMSKFSVQYAATTGTSWSARALSGTAQPGQYFLVSLGTTLSPAGSQELPTPDFQSATSLAVAATAGKLALVQGTTTMPAGACPTGTVVDFVGFSPATTCAEGTPTAAISITTSATRTDSCVDSGNNSADFGVVAPNPRNSASVGPGCAPIAGADLTVTGSATLACPTTVGDSFSYTYTASNLGGDTATGVSVTVTLPGSANATFVSSVPSLTPVGTTLTWNISTLASGASAVLTVNMSATAAGALSGAGASITHSAEVATYNDSVALPNNVVFPTPSATLPTAILNTRAGVASDLDPVNAPGVKLAGVLNRPYFSADRSRWIMVMDTDALGGTTTSDQALLVGQGNTWTAPVREGITVAPTGNLLFDFGSAYQSINNAGHYSFDGDDNSATTAATVDLFVAKNTGSGLTLVAHEGAAVPSVGGAVYGNSFGSSTIQNDGTVSFYASMTGPATTADTALFTNDGNTKLAQEGTEVPTGQVDGSLVPTAFSYKAFDTGASDATGFHMSASGATWSAACTINASTTVPATSGCDRTLVVNNDVKVQENIASVALGGTPENSTPIVYQYTDPNGDWYAYGNLNGGDDWATRNGVVVANTGAPIFTGSTELWDDTNFADTFFLCAGNAAGQFVVGGLTSNETSVDAVLVFNNERVIAREGDPVDLNGDGLANDDAYIRIFRNDFAALAEDGTFYFGVELWNSANRCSLSATSTGQALLRIATSTGPTCGTADYDNDGDSGTDADIEAFFACLGGNCCGTCQSADFDGDGDTGTDADIEAFFRVLGGGQC
jgi:uncharacterized repeat protein (TIGR01451 family)